METNGFLDYLRIVSEYMVTILSYDVYVGMGVTVKPWAVIIACLLLCILFKFLFVSFDS